MQLLARQAQLNRPVLQSAFVIGGIYIVMCLSLSRSANGAERRSRRSPKIAPTGDDPAADDEATLTEPMAAQKGLGKVDPCKGGR